MLTRSAAAEVLGVGVGDPDEVIRASYRKIALSCHPDEQRGGGEARRARERFREVQFNLSTRQVSLVYHCDLLGRYFAASGSLSLVFHWDLFGRHFARALARSHTLLRFHYLKGPLFSSSFFCAAVSAVHESIAT